MCTPIDNFTVCDHHQHLAEKVVHDWDGQCTADLVRSIYEATGETCPLDELDAARSLARRLANSDDIQSPGRSNPIAFRSNYLRALAYHAQVHLSKFPSSPKE